MADIQVLFQDSALLVLNKPAGLATLPDGYDPTLPHIKSILEQQFGRLWIVHRLDKNTSGVLLLARSAEAHRSLNTQFEQHTINKIYRALVVGDPEWEEKTIDFPLRANGDRQHRTVIDLQHGKPAITHLKVLECFRMYSLLQAIPETGRPHQIRAHLAALGLSILGDRLYSPRREANQDGGSLPTVENREPDVQWTDGFGLHAWSLEFTHPSTDEKMKFIAQYPGIWNEVLITLRSHPSNM